MAIHDAYARLTPYELLLPDPEFADRRFPAIGEEAAERAVDPDNPAAFVMLGAVQAILGDLREDDAPRETAHDHVGALHFAYQMWRGGNCAAEPTPAESGRADEAPEPDQPPPVALATVDTVQALLRGASPVATGREPGGAGQPGVSGQRRAPDLAGAAHWQSALLDRAGYLQLPQHLVWMDGAGAPPESVDGLFWHADARGTLHLALAAGVRPDRPGYVFVAVPPQPLDSLVDWAKGPARDGGGDFSTTLPGAELEALVGIRTPAEVYKLAGLLLHALATAADTPARAAEHPPARAAGPSPNTRPSPESGHGPASGPGPNAGPPPTALPWGTL